MFGLRDEHNDERENCHQKSDHVDGQNPGDPDRANQDSRQYGGGNHRTTVDKRVNSAGAGVLILWKHERDRSRVCRKLKSLKRCSERSGYKQVPDLQLVCSKENEYNDRHQPGREIAEHHDQLAIGTVDYSAGNRTENDRRGKGEEAHHCQGSDLSRLLPGKDRDSKPGHPCPGQ